ncbi:MAG: extracellular solute-binding protein [Chloroflexi bacterium]|nr:extracellular solute-binding protein [Chloroflexota bacterium]
MGSIAKNCKETAAEYREQAPPGLTAAVRSATRRRTMQAGTAALTAALAACVPGRPSTAPTSAVQTPVTLRYAVETIAPSGQGTYAEGRQLIVEAFHARGGPIRVEVEAPAPLYTALLAQATAGDPPDVTHTHPREYHPFVNAGALLELDPYLKRDRRNIPDVIASVLEYWRRDGYQYALPNAHTVQALYFNRGMFERQGIKTPDQYEREGKWTFDSFLELGRRLTSGSGESKIYGGFWLNNSLDIQAGFIWSFGGHMWDKAMQSTLLDSKESLEAIQFQAELTTRYGISPTAAERGQMLSGNGAVLAAERAPMEMLMTTALGMVTRTTFAKGMVPMPRGRAGRIVRGAPLGVQLMKGSKHHDAAWEHANFHAGLEAEKIMLGLHMTVAWHRSSLGSGAFAKDLAPWESAAAYAESVNRVRPTRYPGEFTEIDRLYRAAYDTVRGGQNTAARAMAEVKPQINDLLRRR